MKRECILLIEDRDEVREALASSFARAGSLVEAVRAPADASECLAALRPKWVLVGAGQAADLLAWLRREQFTAVATASSVPHRASTPLVGGSPPSRSATQRGFLRHFWARVLIRCGYRCERPPQTVPTRRGLRVPTDQTRDESTEQDARP